MTFNISQDNQKMNKVLSLMSRKTNEDYVIKILKKYSRKEKIYFRDFILWNKLSSNLIDYISLEELSNLFDAESLKKFNFQSTKFQVQSILISEEINNLNKLLIENNFKGIFLKGAALSLFEYDDISLRPMLDIDILLEEKDIINFYKILIKRGYFHAGNISHNQDSLKEYLKFSHQLPGIFSKKNISIELHHRITLTNFSEECPLKDTILKNFRSKKFRDHNLKIPNENDLLLTQLINLTKYPEFKLGALTIFDYSVLNKNYNFDYINLLKAVKNLKARRSLTLATLICDLILNSYENSKGKNADLLNLVEDEIVSIAISRLYQIPGNNIIKNNLPFYLIQNKHFKELIFLFFRKVFPDRRLINYRYGEKSIKFLTTYLYFINFKDLLLKYYKDLVIIALSFLIKNKKIDDSRKLSNWLKMDK